MKPFLDRLRDIVGAGGLIFVGLLFLAVGYLFGTLFVFGGWKGVLGFVLIATVIGAFESAVGFIIFAPFRLIWRLVSGAKPEAPEKPAADESKGLQLLT